MRPAYITRVRSLIRRTTPRSCVTITMAMLDALRSSQNRDRISSWTVASNAVVGSSAISNLGDDAVANAVRMRCFMPPLIWCGYCRTRISGAVMRTLRSSSIASCSEGLRTAPCSFSTSRAWLPIVNSGSSEVIGFCRIIERSRPRSSRICAAVRDNKDWPSNWISPLTRAVTGRERIAALHMVDFPLPDSPTTPTICPASTLKLAFATATMGFSRGPNWTLKSLTDSKDTAAFPTNRCAGRTWCAANRPAS